MLDTELLHYGYMFIVLGTIVEGDATLLTAAFLTHRGYFRLSWVMLIAGLTTMVASHGYFLAARRTGASWIKADGNRSSKLEKILVWSREHGPLLLVASRFMIGFRTLIPVAAGVTGMRPMPFFVWNLVGAIIWSITIGLAGYAGGQALTLFLDDIRRHEKVLAAGLALLSAGVILWRTKGRELLDIWSLHKALFKGCR